MYSAHTCVTIDKLMFMELCLKSNWMLESYGFSDNYLEKLGFELSNEIGGLFVPPIWEGQECV